MQRLQSAASGLRIGIVGAGPGGLTLGSFLHKHRLPFTLFELRPQPTDEEFEKPAGSLDLHEGSGLTAIKELGLWETFINSTRDCSQTLKIVHKNGSILFAEEEAEDGSIVGQERPEIARNKLNRLLLAQIPPSTIQWRHKLLSATLGSGGVELDFGSGNGNGNGKQTFDLVIGADGAWSRVRPLLTDAKPRYAGQQNVTLSVRNITRRFPHLAELIGSGTMMALGDRHGIISQRAAGDTARLYTLISTEDEDYATTRGLRDMTPAQAKSTLIDGEDAPLRKFGPVLKELVSVACDDETAADPHARLEIRPMYTLCTAPAPAGLRWESKRGVTLLGDAAHVMPPNGEGVNMAMGDAMKLAEAIVQAHDVASQDGVSVQEALQPLIAEYEQAMFGRMDKEAQDTQQLLSTMYGADNGAEDMVTFFQTMLAGGEDGNEMGKGQ